MPVNKHALIRYHALDKCFSNFARRYYIEDLIAACNDALYSFTGDEKYSDPINPGISRRQILVDIDFMESLEGWSAIIDRIKDGRRVYYRYENSDFTINNQPITDEAPTHSHLGEVLSVKVPDEVRSLKASPRLPDDVTFTCFHL